MKSPLETLAPFDHESGNLNVVIETPKGCRNKYGFDFELQNYRLKGVLPAGAAFPFDFGSIPGTRGDDGDPLDVLLLMDDPVFTGCLVEARVLGVIEAEQTQKGRPAQRPADRCGRAFAYARIAQIVVQARAEAGG